MTKNDLKPARVFEQLSVQEFVELTNYVGAELERLQAEKNS